MRSDDRAGRHNERANFRNANFNQGMIATTGDEGLPIIRASTERPGEKAREEEIVKLRLQRNSLRLRVSPSELDRFAESGRLEETIYFGPGTGSQLTYILARGSGQSIEIESVPGHVTVLLPSEAARTWSTTGQVGIAGDVDLGIRGTLSVLVEKDFACLDGSTDENLDTFPNPLSTNAS